MKKTVEYVDKQYKLLGNSNSVIIYARIKKHKKISIAMV